MLETVGSILLKSCLLTGSFLYLLIHTGRH